MKQWCVAFLLAATLFAGEWCLAASANSDEFVVVRFVHNRGGRLFVVDKDKDKGRFEKLEVYALQDRKGNIFTPYLLRLLGNDGDVKKEFQWSCERERTLQSKACENLLSPCHDLMVECSTNLISVVGGRLCSRLPNMQIIGEDLVLDIPPEPGKGPWSLHHEEICENSMGGLFRWGRVFKGMWNRDMGGAFVRKGKERFCLSVAMYSNGEGKFAIRYGIWPCSENGSPRPQTLASAVSFGCFSGLVDSDGNTLTITESDTNGVSATARIVAGDKFGAEHSMMEIAAPGYSNEIFGAIISINRIIATQKLATLNM